jgi:hypothetical protein
MALKDVLTPKSKEDLAKSIFEVYSRSKKENDEQWSILHILKENTLGDSFVSEVEKLISNTMKAKKEDVLCIPESVSLHKPFKTFVDERDHSVIKGKNGWDYEVYDEGLVFARSDSRSNSVLITKNYLNSLKDK